MTVYGIRAGRLTCPYYLSLHLFGELMVIDALIAPPSTLRVRWLIRLLLAACLAFGSEILLWNDPPGRSVLDWALIVPGYIVLAALLLDLMVRCRVRDFLGLMTIAGVYGLLNALLVNPAVTLFDIPRTLVSRVTGAHTLLGLELLVAFLALTGGKRLRWVLIVGSAVVGLAWGAWVRWSPEQADILYSLAPLPTMLAFGIGGLVLILLLTMLVFRDAALKPVLRQENGENPSQTDDDDTPRLTSDDLRLTLRESAVIGLIFVLLMFIRLAQNAYNGAGLFLVVVLLGLCGAILWFRRATKLKIILEYHIPVRPISRLWIIIAVAILLWTGILAYSLPRVGTPAFDQGVFIAAGFTLYGLAWLPTVSLILGARAYIRQIQAKPL